MLKELQLPQVHHLSRLNSVLDDALVLQLVRDGLLWVTSMVYVVALLAVVPLVVLSEICVVCGMSALACVVQTMVM